MTRVSVHFPKMEAKPVEFLGRWKSGRVWKTPEENRYFDLDLFLEVNTR